MSKKKNGVKKGSYQAQTYTNRVNAAREATNLTIFQDGMQHALDIASIVLNETFGFGPERLKKFGIGFQDKFAEIQEESREDKENDKERWYSEEQFENALKKAWGQYYTPRAIRYNEEKG